MNNEEYEKDEVLNLNQSVIKKRFKFNSMK
jgi:hypothetical protein